MVFESVTIAYFLKPEKFRSKQVQGHGYETLALFRAVQVKCEIRVPVNHFAPRSPLVQHAVRC